MLFPRRTIHAGAVVLNETKAESRYACVGPLLNLILICSHERTGARNRGYVPETNEV